MLHTSRRLAPTPQHVVGSKFFTLHRLPVEPGWRRYGVIVHPKSIATLPDYAGITLVVLHLFRQREESLLSGFRWMWRVVANGAAFLVLHKVRGPVVQRLRPALTARA